MATLVLRCEEIQNYFNYYHDPGLDCSGFRNKISQTRWHKQQTFIVSRFWRLEKPRPGSGRVRFLVGLPPWPAGDHLLTVSAQGGERASSLEPLLIGLHPIPAGPLLCPHLTLLPKRLYLQIESDWGERVQQRIFTAISGTLPHKFI